MEHLTAEAVVALKQGRMIEAIKSTRNASGLGLKEAKDCVEAYLVAHPEIKEQIPLRQPMASISQESWLRLLLVIAVGFIFWFLNR